MLIQCQKTGPKNQISECIPKVKLFLGLASFNFPFNFFPRNRIPDEMSNTTVLCGSHRCLGEGSLKSYVKLLENYNERPSYKNIKYINFKNFFIFHFLMPCSQLIYFGQGHA